MLKGINPIIPPALLKVLSEMGHGDTIVIADGNFPSAGGYFFILSGCRSRLILFLRRTDQPK